jgi:hypothetical protein
MGTFGHTTDDDRWPLGEDLAIREKLTQKGFRLLLTLAGAAAGWYLAVSGPSGVFYLGPLIGICSWYGWLGPLLRAARNYGAREWELVETRPAERDGDGQIWSE